MSGAMITCKGMFNIFVENAKIMEKIFKFSDDDDYSKIYSKYYNFFNAGYTKEFKNDWSNYSKQIISGSTKKNPTTKNPTKAAMGWNLGST